MRRSLFALKLGILGLLLFYCLPPSTASATVFHRDTYPYGYKSANADGIDSLGAAGGTKDSTFTSPAIKIQDAYYVRIDLTNYLSNDIYTDTLSYFAVAVSKDSVTWSHWVPLTAQLVYSGSPLSVVDTLGIPQPRVVANTIVSSFSAAFSTAGGSYPTKTCFIYAYNTTIPQPANFLKIFMKHGVNRGRTPAKCLSCAAFKYKLVVDVAYQN